MKRLVILIFLGLTIFYFNSAESFSIVSKLNSLGNYNTVKVQSANSQNNNTEHHEIFYGKWMITKKLGTDDIYGYSEEEINKFIGHIIIYSKDYVKFQNEQLCNPFYKKTIEKYKDLSDIAKKNVSNKLDITFIEVYLDKELKKSWEEPPSLVFIKNSDTLIMVSEGVYFELKRKG